MRTRCITSGAAARTLGSALLLLLVLGPLAGALHEAGHAVHAAAPAYTSHDDAAHHAHRPIGAHDDCALCAYAKSQHVLITSGPRATRATFASRITPPAASRLAALDLATLPPPRAPPLAS